MAKLRITLYDPETHVAVSDRLVEDNIEFKNGPKEIHEGPMRIDGLLESSDQVDAFITYLQQLKGNLPLSEKATKTQTRRTKSTEILAADSIDILLADAKKKGTFQETMIDYLRTLNYAFITSDHLQDIQGDKFTFKNTKHAEYQFMVRVLKLAKDPKKDRHDFQLVFGFKLIGDKYARVLVYKDGVWLENLKIHWKDEKEVQFKVKEKFYKFPEPMTYEERSRWRSEDRKIVDSPDTEPSKFYTRWLPYVKKLKALRK